MRQYVPHWEAIGIKKERYLELLHFCRQYPDWKTELSSLVGPSSVKFDGMPHGSFRGDPVAAAAERRMSLLERVRMVDDCAAAVDGGRWYTSLIQNICLARPYSLIDVVHLPSSNRTAFFRARKEFFIRLNAVKGGPDR